MRARADNTESCVFNSSTGLCENCGGKGGNPGPCPIGGGGIHGTASSAKTASAVASKASQKALNLPLVMKSKGGYKTATPADRHVLMDRARKAKSSEDHTALAKRHEELASKTTFSTPAGKASYDAHTAAAKAQHAAAAAHKGTRNNQSLGGTMFDRDEAIATLTANCSCSGAIGEKDKAALNGLSDETLEALVTSNAKPPAFIKKKMTVKEVEVEEEEDDEEEVLVKKTTKNQQVAPMTERMTPEELQVWNYGRASLDAHKQQLVAKLTANIADKAHKTKMVANLMAKSITELNDLVTLIPAPVQQSYNQNGTDLPPIYLGAAGGVDYNPSATNNRAAEAVDVDTPWPPTLNYAEMAKLPGHTVAAG